MSTQARSIPVKTQTATVTFLSLLTWCLALLVAMVAIRELKAPEPVALTAAQSEFSAERALSHVRAIAHVPHPIGGATNQEVREYLTAQLSILGMKPEVLTALGVANGSRRIVIADTHDIVGRLPGVANSRAIMLVAHYDSVEYGPGAGDDAAGVAAVLETVRALRAGPALKNDLLVLFTDGEESGLLGAEAFAASNPRIRDVGLIMNFEGRGNHGPSMLFETSPKNGVLIKAVAESAPHPIGSSLFYALYKLLPNDTDFTVFRQHEIPGLNFAFGENLEAYHSRFDVPENLSLASLQHHGSYALGLTSHFGQVDLAQLANSKGDDVFFDWLGSRLIFYPESLVIPGEILATVLLIGVITLNFRRSTVKPKRILLSLLPSLAILFAIPAALAACGWLLTRLLTGSMIVSDSRANAGLLSGLILLGVAAGSLLFSFFRKRFTVQELSLAGLIVVCFLSWGIALALPAGSYLLFWPLLVMTLGHLGVVLGGEAVHPSIQWLVGFAGAAVTILLFAPFIYLLYVFLTLQLITIVAVGFLIGLFVVLCSSFMNVAIPQGRRWSPAVLLMLVFAVACLGMGIRLSHYSAQHPKHDTILYSLNADDHRAAWISYDLSADEWTAQFFAGQKPLRQPMPDFLAGVQRPVLSAPASPLALAPPAAEIKMDQKDGDTRRVHVQLQSQRKARALWMTFDNDIRPISVRIGGREIIPRHGAGQFSIGLLGMEDTNVDLQLTFKASSAISFWLIDQSSGLPAQIRPRPDNFIAGNGSDVTLVCRKYSM
jgi:MFS family permease